MRRITGTHIYSYAKCPRAVALDFHGDRELRRPPTEVEEFVLRRGRELEDRLTAELGYATPEFPERDFAAGAEATLALMREGVDGILQAVLLEEHRLGIPDLLRRAEGESCFGDYHYVVGDIKSSREPRTDQILQIMFYSHMLGRLQGHVPEYAYLVLRDGHERRFALRDFDAVFEDVEQRVEALRTEETSERPFLTSACGSCRWSDVCLPEIESSGDLSLLQGMTRGLRETLEGCGITTVDSVRDLAVEPTARRTRLESTLLRRLRRAAEARQQGAPIPENRVSTDPDEKALVHMLRDPFADRVYYLGVMAPAQAGGEIWDATPATRAEELPAFLDLIAKLPEGMPIWHYGQALPRWYDSVSWGSRRGIDLEARLVDLARRLRGAAVYPGPVFGLESHVRYGLKLDPHRAGEAGAVGLWMDEGDAKDRVREKGRSDLADLAALLGQFVEGEPVGSDS